MTNKESFKRIILIIGLDFPPKEVDLNLVLWLLRDAIYECQNYSLKMPHLEFCTLGSHHSFKSSFKCLSHTYCWFSQFSFPWSHYLSLKTYYSMGCFFKGMLQMLHITKLFFTNYCKSYEEIYDKWELTSCSCIPLCNKVRLQHDMFLHGNTVNVTYHKAFVSQNSVNPLTTITIMRLYDSTHQ